MRLLRWWRRLFRCPARYHTGDRCMSPRWHRGEHVFLDALQRRPPRDAELILLALDQDFFERPFIIDRLPLRPDARARIRHLRHQTGTLGFLIMRREGPAPMPRST